MHTVIPVFWVLSEEDYKFEASLDYTAALLVTKKKRQQNKDKP